MRGIKASMYSGSGGASYRKTVLVKEEGITFDLPDVNHPPDDRNEVENNVQVDSDGNDRQEVQMENVGQGVQLENAGQYAQIEIEVHEPQLYAELVNDPEHESLS
eukprot:gnl/TRDRNA2_/TRDRNA2_100503_c1_seq1.p2 gnl/TRDRNA2_/TRDRNA2_100503_c1~~gnl/TRDRNA2_/TRDRNA2_100503_c1_seq1.p2  ORF type:complete len:105 (+),score=16.42 gnl/TRDRNA2_/TRDRNA2_100503_c1_seq1:111-425(+)